MEQRRNYEHTRWVTSATRLIKIKEDRTYVQNELYEHLEDSFDGYLEAGFSQADAEKISILNMGEADITAKELEQIYRPFWGNVRKITKFLMAIALLYIVYFMIVYGNQYVYDLLFNRDDYNEYYTVFVEEDKIVYDLDPKAEAKIS